MARYDLPPGFRFHPTDVELIMYYLKRKMLGKPFHFFDIIAELNIYKFGPWDLPDKSLLKTKDREWYFFCPTQKKYMNGGRANRSTKSGYWKATGKDRPVNYNQRTVGTIKTLVFHKGHAPKGERTDWVMHEYRIHEKELADIVQDYVLCKVFQKGGLGPRNGEQYGAPFDEEEWADGEGMCTKLSPMNDQPPYHFLQTKMQDSAPLSLTVLGTSFSYSLSEQGPSTAGPSNFDVSYNLPEDIGGALLDMLPEHNTMLLKEGNIAENNIGNTDKSFKDNVTCMDVNENEIYNGLGDLMNNWGEQNFSANQDTGFVNVLGNMELSGLIVSPLTDVSPHMELNGLNLPPVTCTAGGGYCQSPMLQSDVSAYLELNDLDMPLTCPDDAGEFDLVQPGGTFTRPTVYYKSLDGSYCEGTCLTGLPKFSQLNQYSAPLGGAHWPEEYFEVPRKDGVFCNSEAHGVNAIKSNGVPESCIQTAGSSIAEIPKRGGQETKTLLRLQLLLESISAQPASAAELTAHLIIAGKLNDIISYFGSSIDFKAEVTLKVGECTKDALSHCLGESTCICTSWGKMPIFNLRKKESCYCHGFTHLLLCDIFLCSMHFINTTVQYRVIS